MIPNSSPRNGAKRSMSILQRIPMCGGRPELSITPKSTGLIFCARRTKRWKSRSPRCCPRHIMCSSTGCQCFRLPSPKTAIIDGDCISKTIAAASVIAKVTRDRIMRDFCACFPEYCFGQHKGYGTELHLTKLHELGPCPIHRRSFEPVAQPLLALQGLIEVAAPAPRRARRETGGEIPAQEGLQNSLS